ncbi:MAG: hypothetical protein AAF960_07385 [Bacteroidota bacterium]
MKIILKRSKMKIIRVLNTLLFLIVILHVSIYSHAQSTKIIKYDFKNKTFEHGKYPNSISKGDFYKIVIDNINTDWYDIRLNGKDSLVRSTNPLSNFFDKVNFTTLSNLVSLIAPASLIVETQSSVQVEESVTFEGLEGLNLDENIKLLVRIEDNEEKEPEYISESENLFSYVIYKENSQKPKRRVLSQREWKKIQEKLNKLINKKEEELLNRKRFKKEFIENYRAFLKATSKHNDSLFSIRDSIRELDIEIGKYILSDKIRNRTGTLYSNVSNIVFDINRLDNKFNQIKKSVLNTRESIEKEYDNFYLSMLQLRLELNNKDTLTNVDSIFEKVHVEQLLILENFEENVSSENFLKVVNRLIEKDNISYTYESSTFHFNGDSHELSIEITPRDSNSRLQSYYTKYHFPIQKKKSFWSVSAGTYLSALLVEKPHSVSITQSGTYRIIEESKSLFEFGPNAMINFGKRSKKENTWYFLGIGGGVSISQSLKPRLFLGGGLAFGEKEKLLVGGGIVFGNVDRLSKGYKVNEEFLNPPDAILVSKNVLGLYFSIQYSIFSR